MRRPEANLSRSQSDITEDTYIAPTTVLSQDKNSISVWVLGSGSGSNLRALLNDQQGYRISGVLTDRPCGCEEIAKLYSVPCARVPRSLGMSPEDYDRELLKVLRLHEVDLLFLAGYKRMVTPVLLNVYPRRILNVHPADLSDRKYIGLSAVADALKAGEKRTRSSVIVVNEAMDGGPVIVSGPWLDVALGVKPGEHQEKQKAASDWPATVMAVRLFAQGRVVVDETGVSIDGQRAGVAGYEMEK